MKRLIVILLALCMSITAGAEGLGGLGGGVGNGLSGLVAATPAPNGVLPDPEEILGSAGQVLAEDYAFALDYICTAYTYTMPANMSRFLTEYSALAQKAGYTVNEEIVDGMSGYRISLADGQYALMVPDFNGGLLLLVKNGMKFGAPLPEGYYLQVWRNGRKLLDESPYVEEKLGDDWVSSVYCFCITAGFSRAEVSSLTMNFPNYAQPGDEYRVYFQHGMDGVYFYVWDDGGNLASKYSTNYKGKDDYFWVKVTDMYREADDKGLVIEGQFEGVFKYGELTYSDGSFRVLLED